MSSDEGPVSERKERGGEGNGRGREGRSEGEREKGRRKGERESMGVEDRKERKEKKF